MAGSMAGMAVPIFNIVIGALCVAGGLTGRLSLFGTGSGPALAVAGGVGVALGIYQIWRRQPR